MQQTNDNKANKGYEYTRANKTHLGTIRLINRDFKHGTRNRKQEQSRAKIQNKSPKNTGNILQHT